MAIVSGSVAAIAGLSKLLAGGVTKKALMTGAKKFIVDKGKDLVKDKAKSAATDRILNRRGKGKKKRGKGGVEQQQTGKPGSIVKRKSSAITPFMNQAILPDPEEVKKISPKIPKNVSYSTIGGQLDSITSIVNSIEKVTEKGITTRKKSAANARRTNEKAKKREREEGKEGLVSGIGGWLGDKAKEAGEKFGIFNFIKNLFLGFIALKLLSIAKGVVGAFKFLTEKLHLVWLGIKGFGELIKLAGSSLKNFFKSSKDFLKKGFDPFKNAFKNLSTAVTKLFKSLGNIIPKFVKSAFNFVSKGAKALSVANKSLLSSVNKFITGNTTSKTLGSTKGGLKKLTEGRTSTTSKPGALSNATTNMRLKHGDEAARMYQSMVDQGTSPGKAAKYVKKQIDAGKLTSAPMKGTLGGGIRGSKVAKGGLGKMGKRAFIKFVGKGGFKAVSKILGRIPVVGPLIVAITSLLSGQPVAQALFRAGGAAIGGLLGTFIPVPILGTLLGELVGEYVGDLVYTTMMGGGVEALGKKLKDDITNLVSGGFRALEWAKKGFGRFFKGVPKIKLLGFIETEAPDPMWFINPFNVHEKLGLAWDAFFTDKPIGDESKRDPEVKKEDDPSPPPSKGVTNINDIEAQTKDKVAGDFVKSNQGIKVFDGEGTRDATEAELELYEKGAGNVDGTPPSPASIPSQSGDQEQSIELGERPGSDPSGLFSLPPSSTKSKTEYNAAGGDKSRKIFLHWTAGTYDRPYANYHSVFLGNGKVVRNAPYGQNLPKHTAGHNQGSIGLSAACMHGGAEHQKSWKVPPTQAQLDAMVDEAAHIAKDWGWTPATVDQNVMTHGEWERYATRNGILPAPAQRWDLDKLKPSDPHINTSKVNSHGGDVLRGRIKAKLSALLRGPQAEEEQAPQEEGAKQEEKPTPATIPPSAPELPPDPSEKKEDTVHNEEDLKGAPPAPELPPDPSEKKEEKPVSAESTPMESAAPKPTISTPESGAKTDNDEKVEINPDTSIVGGVKKEEEDKEDAVHNEEDLKGSTPAPMDLSGKTDEELKGMLDPTMMGSKNENVFNAAKEARAKAKEQGLSPEETERAVLEATVNAVHGAQQPTSAKTSPTETPSPQITSQQPTTQRSESVERQTEYESPQHGQPSFMAVPPQTSSTPSVMVDKLTPMPVGGNVLNSYYKAQLLGFLYKFG